ncbi:MAG: FAD-dependent oxidoreductase [Actinobacteria bacterium]|nr:FAD-dependent oxidoreductase [Actinomycetota bacterium]
MKKNIDLNCDTNKVFDYIIIGNSAAGLSAVSAIRLLDKNGTIAVLTNEKFPNYSKPLITYYLAGKVKAENLYFKSEDFYMENKVFLKLNTNVGKIDFAGKEIIADKGLRFKYKKLLMTNGGKPIIPGIEVLAANNFSAGFESENKGKNYSEIKNKIIKMLDNENFREICGIFTFTCLDDAERIKAYIIKNNIKEAVILGGGLIGLKSAEALLEIGIKIKIIELSDRILSATFDKQASLIIENELEAKGSKIYTQNTINKIFIKDNKLEAIKLKNGEKINSKLLIVAVGVMPDLSIIKNSEAWIKDKDGKHIKYGKGIIVDEHMQTNIQDVYAAGDVTESFDFITGSKVNIAVWPLAVRQGEVAGINMAGGSKIYNGGYFMNSIEILQIPSISIGITNPSGNIEGDIEIIKEYKPERKFYKKIIISDKKIIGIILVGNIDRAGIYGGLIKNKVDISNIKENLIKEDFGIIQLPSDYKKHLVVGDGIEV